MTEKLVSAIITTYKREPDMVARAVKSILAQTYSNTEIIVVDDSPAEYEFRSAVKEAVLSSDKRVKYIAHEKNMGACAARNTGVVNSSGEFIAFLDDDDEWLPNKLERQMTKFDDPETGLVYSSHYMINSLTGNKRIRKAGQYTGDVYDELIMFNFIGSTSFVVIRRDILEKAGMFDTQMRSLQDYDMWLRASKLCKVEYIDEPLVNYYIHEGESITFNPKNRIQGGERLIEKNREYLNTHKKALWARTMHLAPMYACDGQHLKAIRTWIYAAGLCPGELKDNARALKQMIRLGASKNVSKLVDNA